MQRSTISFIAMQALKIMTVLFITVAIMLAAHTYIDHSGQPTAAKFSGKEFSDDVSGFGLVPNITRLPSRALTGTHDQASANRGKFSSSMPIRSQLHSRAVVVSGEASNYG